MRLLKLILIKLINKIGFGWTTKRRKNEKKDDIIKLSLKQSSNYAYTFYYKKGNTYYFKNKETKIKIEILGKVDLDKEKLYTKEEIQSLSPSPIKTVK